MGKQEVLTVRGADKKLYKKFRSMAVSKRLKAGKALNQALKYWIEIEEKREVKDPKKLLKTKPIYLGKGNEKLSTTLDEVLYG